MPRLPFGPCHNIGILDKFDTLDTSLLMVAYFLAAYCGCRSGRRSGVHTQPKKFIESLTAPVASALTAPRLSSGCPTFALAAGRLIEFAHDANRRLFESA